MTRAAPRRRAEPARTRRSGGSRRGGARRAEPAPVKGYVELDDPADLTPSSADPATAAPATAGSAREAAPSTTVTTVPSGAGTATTMVEPIVRPHAVALEGPAASGPVEPAASHRAPLPVLALWFGAVLAGLAALLAQVFSLGPQWLGEAGAVTVTTAYTVGLAARTGGRPVIFGGLALVAGVAVLVLDEPQLRSGAAVMSAAVAAVLAVMVTVPAVRFVQAVRECLIALAVAGVGAVAAIGFEPALELARYEYAVLGLAQIGAFLLVYRLGAGLHGLGRRGVVVVLLGGAVLAVSLLYAEMLRRYGTPGLVESLLDVVRWSRDHLGAFPRPIETALGVPALVWGAHMRARRRQGWWVCMFGVAATAPAATSLANPAISVTESTLSVVYGLVLGLLIGYAIVRVDLALTGGAGGGRRAAGRRDRRAEEAAAVRPEPKRTDTLL